MLKRRGILKNEILREPHLHLEQTHAEEMDRLIELALEICNELGKG